MQRWVILSILLGAFVLTGFSSAYADTFTVVSNGNWNNPNTWDLGTVPTDADTAIIPNGFSVTVPASTSVEIGSFTNQGSLTIAGEFLMFESSSNSGNININNGNTEIFFENDFTNSGTFISSGSLSFAEDFTLTNSGTFINSGEINNDSTILNSGIFNNTNTFDNNQIFRNNVGGEFSNTADSDFRNFGTLENNAIATNDGTISNSADVVNNSPGVFTNNNEFFNGCGSTVTGTISGIPVISTCPADPPVFLTFPDDITAPTSPGLDTGIVMFPFPTAADGISAATVEQIAGFPSGSAYPLGVTINTFRATDAEGQTTDASFTVTINDAEAPVILNVPDDIVQDNDPNQNGAVVAWLPPLPEATDNVAVVSFTSTHAPGDFFLIGDTMVVYTAVDAAGNTASINFDVTINDAEVPVISDIPSDIVQDNDAGLNSAVATWTEPTATDNSGSVLLSANATSGDSFSLGTTTVTYTATDPTGNTSTASFDVTINDAEVPVISDIPDDIVLDNISGLDSAVATWTEPTATDNDSIVSFESTNISGDSFPLGTTTVTYTATDPTGNTSTASFDVIVNDAEVPVISDIPGDIMLPTDTGLDSAVATWIEPTATDNSGSVLLSANATSGDSFSLGTTTVTYTATDPTGNTSTASFDVIVNDAEDPVISGIPADILTSLPIGESEVSVSWTEPTATDNGGLASFTSTHTPGDLFSLGTTTVTYTATDNDGNVSTASFDVTVIASIYTAVQDGEWNDLATWGGQLPPESDNKLIPEGITVSNTASFTNLGNIEILGNLTNNCGGSITNSGTVTGLPVKEILCVPSLVSPLDGALIHEEKPDLTWEVNSTEIRPILFNANLEETANPGVPIELVSLSLVSAEPLNKALDGTYAWNVLVDIDPSYNPGYPFVSESVSSSVAIYDVVIIDTTAPVIDGIPEDIVRFIPEDRTSTEVLWIPPTVTDNVDDPIDITFTANKYPGFTFELGETLVTYTAIDTSGNESTASFTVTVAIGETEPPVISGMPDDIEVRLESGEDTIAVFWDEPTATDNVGVTSFTSTHSPGDLFSLGTTTVTYTASDFNGNTSEESFTITVNPSGKFVEPEFQDDLSNKQIKSFDRQVDRWEHEIEKLENRNSKYEERAQKYEDKGKLDKAEKLRDKIASNEAEIEVLEDQIAVVQVSLGDIPVQEVEVEVHEDLSSKAYKGIERDIKKWEKKLEKLEYFSDKLEKRAQKYEDKGKLDKAEKLRGMVDSINAEIAVIEDILEVLECAIDFELPDKNKPHHGHGDDKKGKGHDKDD